MSIEIRNVNKRFGNFHAVRDINLDIASGELLALLGPSGCGKTTLLRIIAGLESADTGQILFSGEDTTDVHVRERRVGFVFQHYALFRHMTVFDNVAFGLRIKPRHVRPSRARIEARVHELLGLVQLDGLADRYPAQLSGGQRQRIALARALAVAPKVLLLDEPFGALDAKVRKELRRWLRRLHDELHVTSIFVTHDQEEALEVADRVVLMNAGRIEQVGAPQEVWDQPASPFVYGFLGNVNLFHGRAENGYVHVPGGHSGSWSIAAPDHAGKQNAAALAFVRPSDLIVTLPDTPAPASASGLPAQLTRALVIGPIARLELLALEPAANTEYDGSASGQILEAELPASEFRALGVREGDTVLVSPRKARVFLQTPDDPALMI
ncbi:MAG: sulfate ABC transporter ATP-binding protein [Burkholderiaceae bacterium]|jgi:sulfate transport system ATP-binding protein|nr:sulfate ABC transporter ATP-binding protein [Burkholderiaceae bacterium]